MSLQHAEEWRPIPRGADAAIDLSSFYEVSSLGNIRTADGKPRIASMNDSGYLVVTLSAYGWNKSFKVHRLVAAAFIPNPSNKPEINHLSGDKADNRVVNLEWATAEENIEHSVAMGLPPSGAGHSAAILTPMAVRAIREKRAAGVKRQALADEYGVSIDTIKAVITRRIWKHIA